ncbi:leucine-rich repeat domain-containing protein [Neorhodopirellula lusitana]|uniref:leucine-rich repeat domain-containing protein n=1 Tax=Neorhodopirellula lusitana TaxID=445327 RepID=UPI00384FD1FF
MIVACFAGSLFGGYAASTTAISKQEEMLNRQMLVDSMDHFIQLGGEIIRQPGVVTEDGVPAVRRLGFYAIDDREDLQKAIFCGGTLPGVKEIDFAPIGINSVGRGLMDGTVLRVVARNFPELEYLDVSHCRVEDLAAIQNMTKLRTLKIANNPLEYAELQSFRRLKNVAELWLGWPDERLDKDSLYRNPEVTKGMLKALSEMPNLKRLHLYSVRVRESERKMLEGVEIVNVRMK